MAKITRVGYGQVEPNHLSAPRNGHVYAQLPAAKDINVLEQGMFVKLDYVKKEANLTGAGPWYLVYNEEKLYDTRHQMHRDFALRKEDAVDGVIVPRVFGLEPGDIYTTNMVKAEDTYAAGDKLSVGADGILAKASDGSGDFLVIAETTMPDGQPAVKIRKIA